MNIIVTRHGPPKYLKVNPRGTVTQRYVFNPTTKRFEPVNAPALRAEKGRK